MGDNADVLKSINRRDGVWYPVLTPNIKARLCESLVNEGTAQC